MLRIFRVSAALIVAFTLVACVGVPTPAPVPASVPATAVPPAQSASPTPPKLIDQPYEFKMIWDWLTMKDGVRLAVTYYMPIPKTPGEKFPAILEMLPYRKDDQFYSGDYEYNSFFAKLGFVGVRVDVRGTGSSEGVTVPHEYSEIELSDGEQVIAQLAQQPWSNGNIGMLGISWSANNALMLALRNPPALKTIIIAHVCDDLFRDHSQYIDGIKQINEYESYMEGDNIMPRSPDYKVDEEYFRTRFDAYPWFLTNLKHQRADEFWRKESAIYRYDQLRIPVFVFGGLLDGYRDTVTRILENSKGIVRAEMGPFNHAYSESGVPGPNHEWRYDGIRWYQRWLLGVQNGIENEPRFKVFVRAGNAPDPTMTITPGEWRYEDWPIKRTQTTLYYPAANQTLATQRGAAVVDRLKFRAGSGIEASGLRTWWGEISENVAPSDEGALVYDSALLDQPVEIIGFPEISLRTSVDAKLANWIVRLEDVQPDGRVTLVTGAGQSGAQRNSAEQPEYLEPGKVYTLSFKLHFTTWAFQPGHRIRIAVTNAQYPAFWPTPYPMTMQLYVGDPDTWIKLPIIPYEKRPTPIHYPPIPYEEASDAEHYSGGGDPIYWVVARDPQKGTVSWEQKAEGYFKVRGAELYRMDYRFHETNENDPAQTRFLGQSEGQVTLDGRTVMHRTILDVRSSVDSFHVVITRRIYENGQLIREKVFDEVIPRDHQ